MPDRFSLITRSTDKNPDRIASVTVHWGGDQRQEILCEGVSIPDNAQGALKLTGVKTLDPTADGESAARYVTAEDIWIVNAPCMATRIPTPEGWADEANLKRKARNEELRALGLKPQEE